MNSFSNSFQQKLRQFGISNKEAILIALIVILVVWLIYTKCRRSEFFMSSDTTEFMPIDITGTGDRYGLRGDRLRRSSIDNWYMSPRRQIMLNDGGGEIWQANGTPSSFGIKDCRIVQCPINDEYDSMDTCWKCGNDCMGKIKIPDMQPHVKI